MPHIRCTCPPQECAIHGAHGRHGRPCTLQDLLDAKRRIEAAIAAIAGGEISSDWRNIPVADIPAFTTRIQKAFQRPDFPVSPGGYGPIETLGDADFVPDIAFTRVPNLGRGSRELIRAVIRAAKSGADPREFVHKCPP